MTDKPYTDCGGFVCTNVGGKCDACIEEDGDCQRCGGSGCVACDARYLPARDQALIGGNWVPSIPLPLFTFPHRHRCECGKFFWTMVGYRGHYALVHIRGGQ